ncbi:MAG: ATP-binding protein, partial [Actinomycetota bacterium]
MSVERAESRWGRLSTRAVVAGVVATAIGGLLAYPTQALGPASGVAIFMLAVTAAAVIGGLWGGVIAAVLASVLRPVLDDAQTAFRFEQPLDLIASVVFLAVAVVVGLVVGNAAEERARAGRREREARLLAQLSTKMLTGDVPERVLDEFVQVLLEPFGLAVCLVNVNLDGHDVSARAEQPGLRPGGPREIVPVVVANIPLGTLIAERPAGRRPFTRDERMLLEAAVRQAAVALDRARLDARARLAQVDAETNQLRAAMFSSVTHDLRTPLASIKAGVTSLLDEGVQYDEDQERELLTTILEETDRLNRLVGNILDLAKVRAGALIPRKVRTAVDEVAEAVVGRLTPTMTAHGLRVDLQLSPTPEVPADPVQLDQVLTNLLENAARHSPEGGTIRVHVGVVPRGVRVRVSDEGPGISGDEREKVFDAFYRGKEMPESPGTGLGLAIAKAIVTAHGGRIWAEETVRGGTAFVFDIPVEESVVL